MNPLSVLTARPGPAITAEQVAIAAADGAKTADFSAMLADQVTPAALPEATTNLPLPAPLGLPPYPAKRVPSGKILPPTLPPTLPIPAIAAACPASRPAVVGNCPGDEATGTTEADERSGEPEPAAVKGDSFLHTSTPDPALIISVIAPAALSPPPREAEAVRSNPVSAPASVGEPRTSAVPVAQVAQQLLAEPNAPTDAPKFLAAHKADDVAHTVRQIDFAPSFAATGSDSVRVVHPAATPNAPAPAVPPHDFAALVDRLAAAREAVAPQTVAVAVSHGEFGSVRLHFRHDDGGLSVSMASADPDFARAVAAAPPVQPTAPAAESTQAAQRDTSQRPFDQAGSQSGGQTRSGQRDDRPARANPPPPRHTASREPRDSGIFA